MYFGVSTLKWFEPSAEPTSVRWNSHSAEISSFWSSSIPPIAVVMPPFRIESQACCSVRLSPIASNE